MGKQATQEGLLIRTRRKAIKLSRRELADQLDVAMESVRNWEQRGAKPEPENAQKLAEILGLDVSEILPALKRQPSAPQGDVDSVAKPASAPVVAPPQQQKKLSARPVSEGKRDTHDDDLAVEAAKDLVAKAEPALRGIQLALRALGRKEGS